MNKKFKGLLLATAYASCGTVEEMPYQVYPSRQEENVYYIPSTSYSPLSSEKNHFSLELDHSSGSNYTGYDLQGGYMVSDKVGLTAQYSGGRNPEGSPKYMTYSRYEFGAGYVVPMKNGWHFETYGGLGKGKIDNQHFTGYSRLAMNNYFLQPALAYNSPSTFFTFGIMSRFSGVNFNVQEMSFNKDRESISAGHLQSLYDKPFHLMWEPGFVMRYGFKNLKLNGGYTYSADLTNSSLHRPRSRFSFGITAELAPPKKQ